MLLIAPMICAIALWGCSSDSDDDVTTPSGNDQTENDSSDDSSSDGSSSSSSSSASLDFDVTWDMFSESDYTDVTDSPAEDDDTDDFIENSTFSSTINIAYDGTSATISGEADGVEVATDGANVTVTSSAKAIEYVLSGKTSDGSFKIYSEKKFKLTLGGVDITSASGAAINIQSSKRVFVNVEGGTTNSLTDASSYTNTPDDEDQKACLFSEGQLLFSGSGSLTISGNYKHGICSDDYVFFHAGPTITVANAKKDAIHTNDNVIIAGGIISLTSSGDGIECEEGSIDIRNGLLKVQTDGVAGKGLKAGVDINIKGGKVLVLTTGDAEYDSDENDISSSACIKCDGNFSLADADVAIKSTGLAGKGANITGDFNMTSGSLKVITTGEQYVISDDVDSSPKAVKSKGNLTITGGTVLVSAMGGEGSEGLESKNILTITGGEVLVNCYDDCLNASSHIQIDGGDVYCYSTGNDAIDSNGTLSITGGTIVAIGTMVPESGFDCDENTFAITGGTVLGIGGTTSNPTASACTQASVIYSGQLSKGTLFSIVSSDASHVMSYTIPCAYNQTTILFSSASLAQGSSYTIYTGGSVSGGSEFYNLVTSADYTAGTSTNTFTASSLVTSVGTTTGGGGQNGDQNGGGQPGGFGGH